MCSQEKSIYTEEVIAQTLQWVRSKEGARAMRKSLARSLEVARKLRALRNVDPQSLFRPFTI